MADPTPEQLENAKAAGWDPADGEPPEGWDAHGSPPVDDPELGNNGVPAPVPGDPDYVAPAEPDLEPEDSGE